ncbi:hypothetical protein AC32_3720 [Escherichia coli 3-105-05_S3_C2]|nr:hypothetical protein ECDEC13C_1860 [Escherichia coli DEC13C]EHX67737.1 hypothetical protein ECDEC13D_0920 [Escherichia coli DEC13D]EHX75375.1 hypothetical protein ECDEC13E_1767 [Escherichia coli DEC13E]EIO75566.1 hypothetical protein ECTW09109_2429 [Escherichia coli TW09109]ESA25249.1 hypothetical protein L912_3658 [Escherichia coli SCD1]EYE24732.1 hypothetical protein AB69_1656 [Escherichia coli 1-110-08_S1_C3]EYE37382.1 hypothetical protein AB10_1836 [Escherichia coli 1-110-08_S1_C1]KDT
MPVVDGDVPTITATGWGRSRAFCLANRAKLAMSVPEM